MKQAVIKVLVADDFDLIREGVKRIIGFEEEIEIVGEATDGDQVLSLMAINQPDVLLLDMNMPIKDGLTVLKSLKASGCSTKVIILTVENDYNVIKEAIHIGADGYVLKESVGKEVVKAIYAVARGDKYIDQSLVSLLFQDLGKNSHKEESQLDQLTKRELEILYHLSKGFSNKEIGDILFISEKTVKNYVSKIFRKINVSDRVRATIFAMENHIERYRGSG